MKRILLSAAVAIAASTAVGQSTQMPKLTHAQDRYSVKVPVSIFEARAEAGHAQEIGNFQPAQRNATEIQIGNSYYDLQTNSSIQRRIVLNPNNTVVATWTFSSDAAWANRGTGYSYFNGSTWSSIPTTQIESERCGWPNPLITGQGKEIILSHNTVNNTMRKVERSTVGSGTWTQTNLTSQNQQVWGRSSVGGTNNNTIHMIGMTLPVANAGTIYNGMDGAFLYNRSTNGGTSFDIVSYQIPGTDSSYFSGFDGDAYAIDALGDNVAIVVGGLGTGVQLYKSTNNGVNWTKIDVMISDVWFEETQTLVDSSTIQGGRLLTSDGSVNVLIDSTGKCHVWYGSMYIANDDITDGLINYYPYTNAIMYWNEDFPGANPVFLTGVLDLNNNQTLDLTNSGGQYRFAGLVSHPQASVDANGCIYLSYSGVREDLSNGSQNYRHTYVMKSCDDGCSWSFPIDVTGAAANNFVECTFPSISRSTNNQVHIVYMADNEPGIAVSGDEDPSVVNKIIYLKENVTRFDTTDICPTGIAGDTFLCSGGTVQLTAIGCANSYSWTGPSSFSSSNQIVNVSNTGTYTCTFNTVCGTQTESITVVPFSSSVPPQVNIQATLQNMCPGQTSTLTALTNVGGATYLWSTGGTTASINVTNPGTYTVTVSTCNSGSNSQSIVISTTTAAPQVIITGDLELCSGQSNVLTAIPVAGATYVWSNGSTTNTTTVNAAGTYTCIITNCAGSNSASVAVTIEAAPVATITAAATEVCEGDLLTATAGGGSTYAWSNGSTNAVITLTDPSESGTYTVTVTNDCGATDEETITLTVHPIPATPVISFNGSTYSSSYSTGTHNWYINGALASQYTGSSVPSNAVGNGTTITCTYVDDNGCESEMSNSITGISEYVDMQGHVSVYPNPNNGQFDIRFGQVTGKVEVQLINAMGQIVYSDQVVAQPGLVQTISASAIESGAYMLKVYNAQGIAVQTIVVQ